MAWPGPRRPTQARPEPRHNTRPALTHRSILAGSGCAEPDRTANIGAPAGGCWYYSPSSLAAEVDDVRRWRRKLVGSSRPVIEDAPLGLRADVQGDVDAGQRLADRTSHLGRLCRGFKLGRV